MLVTIDKNKKKATLALTKASDFDSSFLEKAFPFYKSKPELDDIDFELHPLISEMWANGYRTFNCCSGHGKTLGFILFLPPGKRRLRCASWEATKPVPKDISGLRNIFQAQIILAKGKDGIQPWFQLKKLPQEAVR